MHHFSRMCKSSSKGKPKGAVRKLHVIESQTETDTDSDEFVSHDEYFVSTMTLAPQTEEVNAVRNSTTCERKLYAVMKVGRKLVQFQIDTDVTCNVLKQSDLPQKATIKQTAQVPTLFNGTKVTPFGKAIVKVTNPRTSKRYRVQFSVVKDAATSILGAAASQTIKVQFENIAVLESTSGSSKQIYTDMTNQLTKDRLVKIHFLSLKELLVNYIKNTKPTGRPYSRTDETAIETHTTSNANKTERRTGTTADHTERG